MVNFDSQSRYTCESSDHSQVKDNANNILKTFFFFFLNKMSCI